MQLASCLYFTRSIAIGNVYPKKIRRVGGAVLEIWLPRKSSGSGVRRVRRQGEGQFCPVSRVRRPRWTPRSSSQGTLLGGASPPGGRGGGGPRSPEPPGEGCPRRARGTGRRRGARVNILSAVNPGGGGAGGGGLEGKPRWGEGIGDGGAPRRGAEGTRRDRPPPSAGRRTSP